MAFEHSGRVWAFVTASIWTQWNGSPTVMMATSDGDDAGRGGTVKIQVWYVGSRERQVTMWFRKEWQPDVKEGVWCSVKKAHNHYFFFMIKIRHIQMSLYILFYYDFPTDLMLFKDQQFSTWKRSTSIFSWAATLHNEFLEGLSRYFSFHFPIYNCNVGKRDINYDVSFSHKV